MSFARQHKHNARLGFTILELVITVSIALVMTVLAVPMIRSVSSNFRLRGAVSAATGAIQSTRYQAIFTGCPTRIDFTAATATYQVLSQPYVPATGLCGAMGNLCPGGLAACPASLADAGTPITLNADVTLIFKPGGSVSSPQFPGGGINLIVTYTGKPPETITVSNYGSTNVTP